MHRSQDMRRAGSTRVLGWRRIASAMWSPPDDPQIFGALDVDAAPEGDPRHPAAVAFGITAGADDEVSGHGLARP
jgi:hypothetical protein